MSELLWIDAIERASSGDWQVRTVRAQGKNRSLRSVPVANAAALPAAHGFGHFYHDVPTRVVPISCCDLSRSERVLKPSALVRRATRGLRVSDAHEIYRLPGEPAIYVPAFLLIRTLFMGPRAFNERLLTPQGLDLLATPAASDDPRIMRLELARRLADPPPSDRAVRMAAWAIHSREARCAHASVLDHARHGRIGLDRPALPLKCWASCFEFDYGLLAFEFVSAETDLPSDAREIVIREGRRMRRISTYYKREPFRHWKN
jgi:hypothetical protein